MQIQLLPKHLMWVTCLLLIGLPPVAAQAHCDSLDGPVVQDARIALESGNSAPVLKWVHPQQEMEIRSAFRQTLTVRGKGKEARELADRWFFETLVRLHRAGEGEAFTGLKPAGSAEPGIALADKALRSGSVDTLAGELSQTVGQEIRRRFALAAERRQHAADNVEAGRAYVAAYVDYIHFVESLHRLTTTGVTHKHHEPAAHAE